MVGKSKESQWEIIEWSRAQIYTKWGEKVSLLHLLILAFLPFFLTWGLHLPFALLSPSLMFAPLRPSASVVVSIHLLGRSLTVFAEHEIKGKAVGKTIEAELLQSSISLLLLCPLDIVT